MPIICFRMMYFFFEIGKKSQSEQFMWKAVSIEVSLNRIGQGFPCAEKSTLFTPGILPRFLLAHTQFVLPVL